MEQESSWYFASGGQTFGPMTRQELEQRAAKESLPPETLAWKEGMDEWRPLSECLPGIPVPVAPPPLPPVMGGAVTLGTPAAQPAELEPTPAVPSPHPQARAARPTSLSVFGVINIVFGFFGLLCSPISIISSFAPTTASVLSGEFFRYFTIATSLMGFISSGILLALGIGLLCQKNWARAGSVLYGWFSIISGVISMGVIFYVILPQLSDLQGADMAEAVGGMIGGVIGGIFGMIYPILLIIFMQRPIARAACSAE
ncbi:MAG: DUF4339 domain-containing protein [Kiritimatiellae bacterium]|nr:DUF4339 domain-containing protein [Kiritimatiellia bacterium]